MTNPDGPPPESCAVALKEWAGVCDALADGRQAILLRKGGVAEGPGGFAPAHDAFWFWPTFTHEAEQGLRVPSPRDDSPPGTASIRLLARLKSATFIDDLDTLARLEPFHAWTAETIRKRFEYRRPGLWLFDVRVHRRAEPFLVRATPEQAGCRSWVELAEPLPTTGLAPVLRDAEAARLRSRWQAALREGGRRDG